LYREALRLGFNVDDPLIKHSLKIKMEFLGEAQAQTTEPTADEIEAFYKLRSERYIIPGKISYVHVYFSDDIRGYETEADAINTLKILKTTKPVLDKLSAYGDHFMLKNRYVGQSEKDIRANMGLHFAEEIEKLGVGGWQGPIRSAYGTHLVYIYNKEEAFLPEIEIVKEDILNDIDYENRAAAKQLFYTEILRNYQIEYDVNTEEYK
jgi:hypothetical protein